MTLKDIAALCNVSISTVSKAFADSPEISVQKRNEIFELAKKYGCFEKYYKGKFGQKLVAVICPELRGSFYTEFAAKLNDSITKHGGMMALSVSNFDRNQEDTLIRYYSSHNHADGIILFNGGYTISQKPIIPMVAIGAPKSLKHIDHLHTDLSAGVDEAVEYLKEMGHRDIGFLWETHTRSKYRYFCESMRKYGLPIREEFHFCSNKRFEEGGYIGMKALMEQKERPTAVIVSYDYMALGAIRYAREAGIRIPEDISFIGMDNNPFTAYIDVPLTTIFSWNDELCESAVDLLFKKMDNQFYTAKQEITLKSRLVKRESVKKL